MSAAVRGSNAYLLFVLTLTYAVNWADRQVVPILFPGMRADLGLSDTELGIIGGLAFSLIYAVTGFFFGVAADRYMRIYVIAGGLTLWSLATAAGGFATDFTTLFWARFFTGVGEASLFPCAISLIGERFPPDRRGRALGTFGISSALGAGIGIGLGGRLAETLGWRHVFLIYGLAGLLLLPLVLSLPEARRTPSGERHELPVKVLRDLLTDWPLLLMWLAGCLAIGSALGYAAWLPSFFIRNHGFDVTTTGTIFGIGSLIGGIGGSLLGGLLADRRAHVRFAGQFDVSVGSALIAIPLLLLTINNWTAPIFLTAGLVALIAIYAFFPPLQAVMVSLVPKERHGIASSLNVFFLGGLGSALGPFVVGFASDRTGSLHTALNVPVIGLLLAAFLAGAAGRLARRSRHAPLAPEARV
jgi:predicted MFS family arabinose efflux permease